MRRFAARTLTFSSPWDRVWLNAYSSFVHTKTRTRDEGGTWLATRLIDVARAAGVSVCTASRVLNAKQLEKVSPATQARVRQVAHRLGYRPNVAAKGLVKGLTYLIGVVLPHLSDSFFAEVVEGIQEAAEAAGYSVLLFLSRGDVQREERALASLRRRGVDGILYTPGQSFGMVNQLVEEGLPVLQMANSVPAIEAPYIDCDHERGAYLATQHLVHCGHTRIAHLSADVPGDQQGAKRCRGYRQALLDAGITPDPELIKVSGYSFTGGYQATYALCGRKPAPSLETLSADGTILDHTEASSIRARTGESVVMPRLLSPSPGSTLSSPPSLPFSAIFAASDMAALGALRALQELGYRVPDDVAIVGFDDLPSAAQAPVPLSTIAQPKQELGTVAFAALLDLIEGRCTTSRLLNPELVVRQSSGPRRPSPVTCQQSPSGRPAGQR